LVSHRFTQWSGDDSVECDKARLTSRGRLTVARSAGGDRKRARRARCDTNRNIMIFRPLPLPPGVAQAVGSKLSEAVSHSLLLIAVLTPDSSALASDRRFSLNHSFACSPGDVPDVCSEDSQATDEGT
jgi:hypothetical protein